jgi:hypothetical protein
MPNGGAVLTEKITYWWSEDGKWFCILAQDATVSLTPAEATALERSIGGVYGREAAAKRARLTYDKSKQTIMAGDRPLNIKIEDTDLA